MLPASGFANPLPHLASLALSGSHFHRQLKGNMIYPEFDKEKASPEGPEMPKYKANWREAKEINSWTICSTYMDYVDICIAVFSCFIS